MAYSDPYNQYLNVQFGTADQGTLIMMVIDGSIRFCDTARDCIKNNDAIGKGEWLSRAYDSVSELRKSLRPDVGGDIAKQLSKSYEFICRQITIANVMNSVEPLENALTVLGALKDAWSEVIRNDRKLTNANIKASV